MTLSSDTFANCHALMRKLCEQAIERLDEDEPEHTSAVVDVILEKLGYHEDETVSAWIVLSILMHDGLAEVLDGRL